MICLTFKFDSNYYNINVALHAIQIDEKRESQTENTVHDIQPLDDGTSQLKAQGLL